MEILQHHLVSVPLPGFSGLRLGKNDRTSWLTFAIVSVPLPGFSGLRLEESDDKRSGIEGFSPVAGIQWVETPKYFLLSP